MKRKPLIVVIGLIAIALADASWAGRPDKDWKRWFGHVAGGYSAPTSTSAEFLEGGYNFNGGATYWPEHWPVGIDLELGYNTFDVKREVLDDIRDATGFDDTLDGDVDIWSLTVDGMWGPPPGGGINVYFAGGLGVYHEEATLSTPVAYSGIVCDPWWYWCVPGVITGEGIIDSESETNFGYNLGVGLTFELGLGSQIYLEAKYHRVERDREPTDYIPIVIGYRW
ncbi:MAG TPA: outer membrane beta-barrel protein [Candidatus Polarisedimenticolaceae bacterium]|nr:outer membrane beta-barrel protein [Candidatus Polarisedimenticolaceae bacterium]